MRRDRDVLSVLRWYPKEWRERYGDEFVALVHEGFGEGPLPLSLRRSIALSGLRERGHYSGLIGERSAPNVRRRTGSLVVLVAWALTSVGVMSFSKSAEHFSNALPSNSRTLAQVAYDVVAAAGLVGSLFVAVGAGIAVPAFVRFLRGGGWLRVRRLFAGLALTGVTLAVATAALGLWAHHLDQAQRNGADHMYVAAFLLYACAVVFTIAAVTRGAIVVVTQLELSPGVLRTEGTIALAVCVTTLAVATGASLWIAQMSLHAPWFFQGTTPGVAVSPWSPPVVVTLCVLIAATTSALFGASRLARSYRRIH